MFGGEDGRPHADLVAGTDGRRVQDSEARTDRGLWHRVEGGTASTAPSGPSRTTVKPSVRVCAEDLEREQL